MSDRVHTPRVTGVVYCLGFLFTEERDAVVLIEKSHPDWQRGKFNGIGGHVELNETPASAMRREANEEAGISFGVRWTQFAVMAGVDWTCYCYRAFETVAAHEAKGVGDGDERIFFIPLDALDARPLLPNLRWLIPLALDQEVLGGTRVSYAAVNPSRVAAGGGL